MPDRAPTMKALVVLEPNRVEIQDVPTPTPGPNEVLARVRAVSICGTDVHLVRGDYPGLLAAQLPVHPGPRVGRRDRGPGPRRRAVRLEGRRPRRRHLPRRLRLLPEVRRGPLQPLRELRQARAPQAVRAQLPGRGRDLRRPGREDHLHAARRDQLRGRGDHRPGLDRPPCREPGRGGSRRRRRDHRRRRDRAPVRRRGAGPGRRPA